MKSMSKKSVQQSSFGKYLDEKNANRAQVAAGLGITQSYVHMLCRGSATPGLKLALKIDSWCRSTFNDGFEVSRWT